MAKLSDKPVEWRGPGEVLRPMEGGKGADVVITPTKSHKDYSMAIRTILKDEREVVLAYLTVEQFIENEMFTELDSFMYFLEFKLSEKGAGLAAFLQAFTGIYDAKGVIGGIKKSRFSKNNNRDNNTGDV